MIVTNKNKSLKTQSSISKRKPISSSTISLKRINTIPQESFLSSSKHLRYDSTLFHKTIFHLKPLHENPELFTRQRSISSKALNSIKQYRPIDTKAIIPHPIQMKLTQMQSPNRQKVLREETINHITAKKWIIYSMPNKLIIKGYKYRMTHQIASLSKLLTFYTAYEIIKEYFISINNLDLMVTLADNKIGGSKLQLNQDDESLITLQQALYCLIMVSSNNIALTIANNLGSYILKKKNNSYFNCFDLIKENRQKNINTFVDLMNKFAKQMELNDSTFVNPHGLSSNKGSAFDVARLASQCFKIPIFCKISSTRKYLVRPKQINDHGEVIHRICMLQNTNKLLYEGCLGGKTGSNTQGGDSFVGYFQGGIMIVVLGSAGRTQKFKDCMRLAQWVDYKLKLSYKE